VLVVGHEAEKINSVRDGFEIESAAPVLINPGGESGFAGRAGRVGNGGDRELQVFLVKGVGSFADEIGESIAVGPVDILEVQLEADIAVVLTCADHGGKDLMTGGNIEEELVDVFLSKTGVDEEGHNGNMVLACGFKNQRIGAAGEETAGVEGIPGGNEDIDLVGVGQEGAYGLWLAGEIEERQGLLRASGYGSEGRQ
jgi:hypothetical protein